jgi:hypothetical protein
MQMSPGGDGKPRGSSNCGQFKPITASALVGVLCFKL